MALERFGGVYVKRVDGKLASICGVVGQATSPGGRRIGRVDTPPDVRKCGHATELVKSVTSVLLDDRTGPGFAVIVVPAAAPGRDAVPRAPGRRRRPLGLEAPRHLLVGLRGRRLLPLATSEHPVV